MKSDTFKFVRNCIFGLIVLITVFYSGYMYKSFEAVAREKEGFALVGGLYQAAQASKSEHQFYPKTLSQLGFASTGTLAYQLFYYSTGESFRSCALPLNGGTSILMDENKKITLNAHVDCAKVVVNHEKGSVPE